MSDEHAWLPPGFRPETIRISPDQLRAVAALLYERRDDIAGRGRKRGQRHNAVLTIVGYLSNLAADHEATPPKETTMSNPDQPTLDDVRTSIAEATELGEAIRLALFATAQHPPVPLAEALEDRVWEEDTMSRARERDQSTEERRAEEARRARYVQFDERRTALDMAVMHHRNLSEPGRTVSPPKIADVFSEFHDLLTGADPQAINTPAPGKRRRGVDELIRDTSGEPNTQVHVHGIDTVYREDNRIRRADGTGYADSVSDKNITDHLAEHAALGNGEAAAFCRAVLAIRAYERTVL